MTTTGTSANVTTIGMAPKKSPNEMLDDFIHHLRERGTDYGDPPQLWPAPLDLEALAEMEPATPRFIVPDLLPCGYATLFAGHGGVGKSQIALYLAVCIAAGVPFFGIEVQRRRTLYLSCEDRESILHWRLSRICAHLGLDLARLRGWLDVIDLVGVDSILWQRDPRTGYALTPAYGALGARIENQETELLVLDGVSDGFGGNENNRSDVKAFVNSLLALIPIDGALLALAHVNKQAASKGATAEGYSGSTQWHNAARARWYLYAETRDEADAMLNDLPSRTGDLILELQKSNLSGGETSMRFAWDEEAHLFLGREIQGATAGDRAHRGRLECDGILTALRANADPVPAATSGQRTAYHVLSVRPEFPDSLRSGTPGRRRFWRHIEQLRANGEIREDSIRAKHRHNVAILVASSEVKRECANVD